LQTFVDLAIGLKKRGEISMTRLTTVKRSIGRYGAALALIISASLIGGSSIAQAAGTPTYPTAFSVNYFNNPGTNGMDEIYIQNETNNSNSIHGTNICALIYAFYPDQEMVGCCGVMITPNETYNQSVGQLMIHIDEAGPLPTTGTIKVVATTVNDSDENNPSAGFPNGVSDGFDCDPTGDTLTQIPTPHALNSWITHTITFAPAAPGTFMTEEPFAQTGEPVQDLGVLESQCQTVSGSGFNTCTGSL